MKQTFFHIIILLCFCCCKNNKKENQNIQILERKDSIATEKKQDIIKPTDLIQLEDTKTLKEIGIVYVTADNGLTYREQPNINSNKIGSFDFGSKLAVIENTGISFEVNEKGKTVTGEWIKVNLKDFDWKKPYEKQTGYVFNGFVIDSLNANFPRLPKYFGFLQSNEVNVKFNDLNLIFSNIKISEFNKYIPSNNSIEKDSTKIEPLKKIGNPQKGGYFLLKTNKNIIKFSCGQNYRRPCYIYEGYIKELNSYSIGSFGDGMAESFLLDKSNNSKLHPVYEYDHGSYGLNISPSKENMMISSSIDYDTFKDYYDFRSYIVIYDIKNITSLSDIKNAYVFTSKDWEMNSVYWVDDKTFVMDVFNKTKKDKNGSEIPIDIRYLKATME